MVDGCGCGELILRPSSKQKGKKNLAKRRYNGGTINRALCRTEFASRLISAR